MKALRVLFVVLFAATTAFAGRPVARWDTVAYQRIDAPFKVGVVAFHPEGVKVEFRVNGTLAHTAENPTLNDRVNVWEFWFTFDPAAYADGPVTIDAKCIALNGTDPDYDMDSLDLFANSGGTLDVPTITWADAVNGSDTNPGTEAAPFATLNKAVDSTPVGGTIYLKAGTYQSDAINAGKSRTYWTTIAAAPGLGWDDVEIASGRPSTDKLKLQNLSIFSNNNSGDHDTILEGELGATILWLDNVKAWNKNGRYGASTFVTGNGYTSYVTGGLTTWTREGPRGRIVRDNHVQTIGSDVFTGSGMLVVNCTADDTDCGTTGWHPDFHQSYAVAPDWCQDFIMYNVKATNQNCQGFFGLRLRNSAFVNVIFERVDDVDFRSQYSGPMENDMWFHVTHVNQSFAWRGTGTSALAATDLSLFNCVFTSMSVVEDATDAGLDIDTNHFINASMGTNFTTGDPMYIDTAAEDFNLQTTSPAYGTGKYLQCVPADINGKPYDPVSRNKGALAIATVTANAGADQTVYDVDKDGSEPVTLDGADSYCPEGSIVSYVWSENASQIATGVAPTITLAVGVHTIDLLITDSNSATDTDSVTVTVAEPGAVPPTANAGIDQATADLDGDGSEDITLDGSGSFDVDGVIVSYSWQEAGVEIATGVSPTVTLNVALHVIDLVVTDDNGRTGTDTVEINIAPAPSGAVYTITGHTDDMERRSDGSSNWIGQASHRVGGATGTADSASLYVFELPALEPGETVVMANLDFNLEKISNSPGGNVDLYGLAYRGDTTTSSADFFQGAFDTDDTDAWAIQDDILTLQTPVGVVSTSDAADAALVDYLAAQYDAGAAGGDFVVLRLNPDIADVSSYYYWTVTSANGTAKPVLTVGTGVPTPTDKPGDANGDGKVNLEDFVILKTNFGQTPLVDDRADFNNDGKVDLEDFVILKTNFGS